MIRLCPPLDNGKILNIKNIQIKKSIKIQQKKDKANCNQVFYFNQIMNLLVNKKDYKVKQQNGKVFRISKQIIEILEKVLNKLDKMK